LNHRGSALILSKKSGIGSKIGIIRIQIVVRRAFRGKVLGRDRGLSQSAMRWCPAAAPSTENALPEPESKFALFFADHTWIFAALQLLAGIVTHKGGDEREDIWLKIKS
jgi:hypothetical protein